MFSPCSSFFHVLPKQRHFPVKLLRLVMRVPLSPRKEQGVHSSGTAGFLGFLVPPVGGVARCPLLLLQARIWGVHVHAVHVCVPEQEQLGAGRSGSSNRATMAMSWGCFP
jgi:hypothetical protein